MTPPMEAIARDIKLGGKEPFISIKEEEGLLDDDRKEKGLPHRCYVPVFVLGFTIVFSLFSLILWGASKSQNPIITMKGKILPVLILLSITFKHFAISAGSDASGVATDMVSMNSTVKFTLRNTVTFFGVHVISMPIDLSYYQLTVSTRNVSKYS
ncbi:hypothetical protein NE237_018259 [Protea cynaroides]|uniref:Uncharacterized protein n=1 Tax=Protea cynaroides TaxID=273540 RepID=A0A9Q0K9L2_9MAGN|nr:hypothetical protein NE237_018259 [Protea cynaroides]